MMQICFYLLRAPEIEVDGQAIFDELNHKSIALLFYLAVSENKLLSRDELSELLWPNQFGDSARSNLRQSLSAIKKVCVEKLGLEDSIIDASKGSCKIVSTCTTWVDVRFFCEMIGQARADDTEQEKARHLREAVHQYHAPFLEGFYVKGSAAFEEWILYERESLNRMFAEACKELSSLCVKLNRVPQAIEYMTKLLKLDSLREDVYQSLIRLHLRCGDRPGAIGVYQKCEKVLREELNISPMAETRKLYERALCTEQENRADSPGSRPGGRMPETRAVLDLAQVDDFLADLSVGSASGLSILTVRPNPLGMLAFEGVYSLVEQLLAGGRIEAELKQSLAVFSPVWAQEPPAGAVGMVSDIYLFALLKTLLLSHPGGQKQILVFRDIERLDQKTQQLLKYLWWNLSDADICLVAASTPTQENTQLLSLLKASIPENIKEDYLHGNDL